MGSTAFLFPGQGAQTVGMGRQLADALPGARRLYDRAAVILGYDLAQLCFEGPAEVLDSTAISQPALFVTSLAALEGLRREAPETVDRCQWAAGLSLGEYTALVFAGALSFDDGLRVVACRGAAMQAASDAAPSGMVSILGLDPAAIETLCQEVRGPGETLEIANLLCPGNVAISGSNSALERAARLALERGAMKAVPLAVAGAFHTELMQSAVEKLSQALEHVPLAPPRVPVIANVDARPHDEPSEIRRLLVEQVVSPVRWEDSMRYLLAQEATTFYEIGPGRVLRGLLRRIDRQAACENVMV